MTLKKRAERELGMYRIKRASMEGLTEQIKTEKGDTRSLRAARAAIYHDVRKVERGLAALSDQQRRILEVFYIDRCSDHVWVLCDELFVESAEVYRRKERALRDYIFAVYGVEI